MNESHEIFGQFGWMLDWKALSSDPFDTPWLSTSKLNGLSRHHTSSIIEHVIKDLYTKVTTACSFKHTTFNYVIWHHPSTPPPHGFPLEPMTRPISPSVSPSVIVATSGLVLFFSQPHAETVIRRDAICVCSHNLLLCETFLRLCQSISAVICRFAFHWLRFSDDFPHTAT